MSRLQTCWNDPREIPTPHLISWIILLLATTSMACFTGYKDKIDLTILFGSMAGFDALVLLICLCRYLYVRKRLVAVTMV